MSFAHINKLTFLGYRMTHTIPHKKQHLSRRKPQQERAQEKVGLILEAATRLLEQGTIATLTTNAIADKAGVSIGTLYQYFDGKDAVLDALADRETAGLSERVIAALNSPPPEMVGGRIGGVINAILSAYAGRRRAHRLIIEHSLTHTRTGRLNPLHQDIVSMFTSGAIAIPSQPAGGLSAADAFVLTHAISGVLRAFVSAEPQAPSRTDIEASLTRFLTGFLKI
jgi:AcrR family transcriptional regulator